MSKDPHEVLGVARGATKEEIEAQRKKLAFEFHPDRNQTDPFAERILALINGACDSLIKPKNPQRPEDPMGPNGNEKNPQQEAQARFFEALEQGPESFEAFLSQQRGQRYFSDEDIKRLLDSSTTWFALTDGLAFLITKKLFSGEKYQKAEKFTPEECREYFGKWKKVGVRNIEKLLKSPEIIEKIRHNILSFAEDYGAERFDEVADLFSSWKKEGNDIVNDELKEKVQKALERQTLTFFEVNVPSPEYAERFFAAYEKVGFSLRGLMKTDFVNTMLAAAAMNILSPRNGQGDSQGFVAFVEAWKKMGWEPRKKIAEFFREESSGQIHRKRSSFSGLLRWFGF